MVKATLKDTVVAESEKTVIVEGNHYFPPEDVKLEYFTDSETTTECPWKGTANYYNFSIDGITEKDAAWYYHDPKTEKAKALHIQDFVAFYKTKFIIG